MDKYKIGDVVEIVDVEPLKGNAIAPPLNSSKKYTILGICEDKESNQHLDLGLKSEYNFISSYETGQHLPQGDTIHWVHPSRVKLINK